MLPPAGAGLFLASVNGVLVLSMGENAATLGI